MAESMTCLMNSLVCSCKPLGLSALPPDVFNTADLNQWLTLELLPCQKRGSDTNCNVPNSNRDRIALKGVADGFVDRLRVSDGFAYGFKKSVSGRSGGVVGGWCGSVGGSGVGDGGCDAAEKSYLMFFSMTMPVPFPRMPPSLYHKEYKYQIYTLLHDRAIATAYSVGNPSEKVDSDRFATEQQYELSRYQLLEDMDTPVLQQYLKKYIKITHMASGTRDGMINNMNFTQI
ncbi:hypothetical protein Tco_0038564 [Tanacetum coccineum]